MVRGREREPEEAQDAYVQEPQEPNSVAPHETPFVEREHGSDCVEVTVEQPPAAQTGVITVRLRVPVRSHVSAKPPQALQSP